MITLLISGIQVQYQHQQTFAVVGELVKNAFIARSDDTLYLADADGNFVTNKAVVINTDANLTLDNTTYNNAYILFGKDGKAICGYEGTRKEYNSWWCNILGN